MSRSYRSPMDPGLLVAIERNCSGANAHALRDRAHTYDMACFLGDQQWIDRARRQRESELIKAEYQHETRITDTAEELVMTWLARPMRRSRASELTARRSPGTKSNTNKGA